MYKGNGRFWFVFFALFLPGIFGGDMSAWSGFGHWLNRPRKARLSDDTTEPPNRRGIGEDRLETVDGDKVDILGLQDGLHTCSRKGALPMNKTEVTKKRVFIVSFLVILATIVAYTAVNFALSALVAAKGFDAWTVGLWSSLGGAIAFYGVLIGLIWWAYPRTRARVEHPARFYVRRHWRGESGLGISWWANGIPVGVLVAVASAGLDGLDMAAHPTAIALGYVGMIVLGLVLIVWHWVGVWRSAGHAQSAFWGVTARVLTVMAFGVQVANAANHSIPSATEMVNIAFGTDAIPHHRLRILNGGKEIELAGGIDFGTVTDFKVLLDATPAVETIDLNNIGGRVAEAEKLRDIVQARHLSTYTSTMCASACTVVFMAGQQRYLGANGKLGFHRWSFPGLTADQDAAINAGAERAMVAAGVTAAFATKAFSTPANDLWIPDTATLLAAHVVTRLTDGNNFALTAGDPTTYTIEQVDRIMAANPVLAALKRWEPARYAQIIRDFGTGVQQGKTQNDLLAAVDPPIMQVVESYKLIADDDVQLQIARTFVNHARLLLDHPVECTGMFDGTSATYIALLPREVADQNKDLSARIIESGATHPSHTLMPQQTFDEEKRLIWQSVFSAYPSARTAFSSPLISSRDALDWAPSTRPLLGCNPHWQVRFCGDCGFNHSHPSFGPSCPSFGIPSSLEPQGSSMSFDAIASLGPHR